MDAEYIEVWKVLDFIGFDNYAISNWGRAKSLVDNHGNKREKILKPIKNTKGYLQVNLYKDGKVKPFFVHRLVSLAFIPNPNNLPEINHKNEDKTDNRVENLEFCDRKYNANYGTCIKRRVEKQSKPVNQYTKDGILVGSYPSAMEASRQTGFNQGYISTCCRGERKTHKGYIWKYQ